MPCELAVGCWLRAPPPAGLFVGPTDGGCGQIGTCRVPAGTAQRAGPWGRAGGGTALQHLPWNRGATGTPGHNWRPLGHAARPCVRDGRMLRGPAGQGTVTPVASGPAGALGTFLLPAPPPHPTKRSSRFYSIELQRARGKQRAANSARLFILTDASRRCPPVPTEAPGPALIEGQRPQVQPLGGSTGAPPPPGLPLWAPTQGQLHAASRDRAERGSSAGSTKLRSPPQPLGKAEGSDPTACRAAR